MDMYGLGSSEVVMLVVILLPVALSVYCAVRVIRSRNLGFKGKILWLLVLLIPLLGPICYFLFQYRADQVPNKPQNNTCKPSAPLGMPGSR